MDPENAHEWVLNRLQRLSGHPALLGLLKTFFVVDDPRLTVMAAGLRFPNPVGLAAGLDKEARLLSIIPSFGFGFAEVGTFTIRPQTGQERPRLFRIPAERALINRMGFNNPGADDAVGQFQRRPALPAIPIGVNIGKSKDTPVDHAAEEYATLYRKFAPVADYMTVNVSSPNTPGLRNLQNVDHLKEILMTILELNVARRPPLFVKIAPDLADEDLHDIAQAALFHRTGLIATNTTLDHGRLDPRRDKKGGLSGAPLRARADDVLQNLRRETKGEIPLIGVGGVFNARDAYRKIRLGATLVQLYTGWIYEGPGLIPAINKGLINLLKRDGFKSISEAVGTAT